MEDKNFDELDLGRTLYEIASAWKGIIDLKLNQFGLNRAKFNVITQLSKQGDENFTQGELSKLCYVEPPTMASLLAALEKEGWVKRNVCPIDRRRKRTELTSKAIKIRSEITNIYKEVEIKIFSIISETRYKEIRKDLKKIKSEMLSN